MVDDTRRRGWSLNLEDLTDGVSSLGAAIDSGTGTPSYALSVAGLTASYRGPRLTTTATSVVAAAEQLGRLFAGRY
jgi:DNA-binding IclR family transcriptional regulator